jgi:hypothetical protein
MKELPVKFNFYSWGDVPHYYAIKWCFSCSCSCPSAKWTLRVLGRLESAFGPSSSRTSLGVLEEGGGGHGTAILALACLERSSTGRRTRSSCSSTLLAVVVVVSASSSSSS